MMCWMASRPGLAVGGVAQAASKAVPRISPHALMRRMSMLSPGSVFALSHRTRSAERYLRPHRSGAIVPRGELHLVTLRPAHDPFDLGAVVGDVMIGPERHAGVLVRLALELA